MKTLKTLSKVIFAAGVMALAVACSKKSDNTNPYYGANGFYPNGCPTCVGGMPGAGSGPLLSNVQFSTGSGGLVGVVNLGGNGAGILPNSYQGQMTPYQMSPYGNGVIQINSQSYCAYPGQYQIVGVSGGYAGTSSAGIMNGITIQAQGPGGSIVIQASSAEVVFSSNRLGIGIGQLIVNGQSCGSIATY